MSLEERFERAAEEAKALPKETTNEDMLEMYGLYKQAKFGDNTTGKPGIFDPKGRAKWNAWESRKGMSKEEAMQKYIDLIEGLKVKYGVVQPQPAS